MDDKKDIKTVNKVLPKKVIDTINEKLVKKHFKFKKKEFKELAYKGEVLEWIKTGSFTYDEYKED